MKGNGINGSGNVAAHPLAIVIVRRLRRLPTPLTAFKVLFEVIYLVVKEVEPDTGQWLIGRCREWLDSIERREGFTRGENDNG